MRPKAPRTGLVLLALCISACAGDGTRGGGRDIDAGATLDAQTKDASGEADAVLPPPDCSSLCRDVATLCPNRNAECLNRCINGDDSQSFLAECLDRNADNCPLMQSCFPIPPSQNELCHSLLCPENPSPGEQQCYETPQNFCEDVCRYCCPTGRDLCRNSGCPQANEGPPLDCPEGPGGAGGA